MQLYWPQGLVYMCIGSDPYLTCTQIASDPVLELLTYITVYWLAGRELLTYITIDWLAELLTYITVY